MRRMYVAPEFPVYPDEWHFAPVLDTAHIVTSK
jgi:hypothetical protein